MSQFIIGSTNGPALNETNALWIRLPRITTANRDSLLTPNPPQTGTLIDNISSDVLQRWNGTLWQDIITSNTLTNLYNSDGTLTGQREVLLNGNSLQFLNQTATGTTSIYMNDNTISINANNSLFAAPNTNNINTQWLQSDNGANWFLELATSSTVNTLELTSLTLSDVVRFIYRDGNLVKTGLQYLEFGESDWEDSGATADYSDLKNNSLVPKLYVDTFVNNFGNIYTIDGTITGNRNVLLDTYTLTIGSFLNTVLEISASSLYMQRTITTGDLNFGVYDNYVGMTINDTLYNSSGLSFQLTNTNGETQAILTDYRDLVNQKSIQIFTPDASDINDGLNLIDYSNFVNNSLITKGYGDKTFIKQLGNTFGANIIIGTNDTYAFNIKTDNIIRFTIDTFGKIILPNTLGILPKLEFNNTLDDYNIIEMIGDTSNITFGQFGDSVFGILINSANSLSLTNTGTLNQLNIGANTNDANHIEFLNSSNSIRIGNNTTNKFFIYDPALVGNRFEVKPSGLITVGATLTYENLVLADNDIPNRKFVTDLFANNIIQNGNSFGANIIIGTNDNFSLNLETAGVTKARFDTDGGLELFNLATDRYALTVTNAVDNNNYTRWVGTSTDYLIGFQPTRFLVKNNTTNADILSYVHTSNSFTLGNTTISQNVISLPNSNAGYTGAAIGLNSTRKFYYTDGTTVRLWVKPSNVIATDTTSYETLVVADNDIPNRKWVVDNTLTSLYPQGRILWVSKSGNNTEAVVGRIDRPYLTIQAAVTAATSNNDVIHILPGAYTENVVLPDADVFRHFIFEGATLIGSLTNVFSNLKNYGVIIGLGTSFITGGVTITGNASNIDRIFNMRLNVLSTGVNIHDSCVISTTASGTLTGIYTNCTISTGVTLVSQYGAAAGFTLKDSTITCGNFVDATGGLSSAGGNFIIRNCKITCTNFLSARGSSVLQITESQVKASGSSHFINGDAGGVWKVYASNCLFETGCTFLNQNTTDTDSIFNVISNKTTNGAFNGTLTVVSTLNII